VIIWSLETATKYNFIKFLCIYTLIEKKISKLELCHISRIKRNFLYRDDNSLALNVFKKQARYVILGKKRIQFRTIIAINMMFLNLMTPTPRHHKNISSDRNKKLREIINTIIRCKL
jgi:hypothetical protein